MTDYQRRLARHALGLNGRPNIRVQAFRNHYVATKGTPTWTCWQELVADGLALRRDHTLQHDNFSLTRSGAEAALNPGESLDPEGRYR